MEHQSKLCQRIIPLKIFHRCSTRGALLEWYIERSSARGQFRFLCSDGVPLMEPSASDTPSKAPLEDSSTSGSLTEFRLQSYPQMVNPTEFYLWSPSQAEPRSKLLKRITSPRSFELWSPLISEQCLELHLWKAQFYNVPILPVRPSGSGTQIVIVLRCRPPPP